MKFRDYFLFGWICNYYFNCFDVGGVYLGFFFWLYNWWKFVKFILCFRILVFVDKVLVNVDEIGFVVKWDYFGYYCFVCFCYSLLFLSFYFEFCWSSFKMIIIFVLWFFNSFLLEDCFMWNFWLVICFWLFFVKSWGFWEFVFLVFYYVVEWVDVCWVLYFCEVLVMGEI